MKNGNAQSKSKEAWVERVREREDEYIRKQISEDKRDKRRELWALADLFLYPPSPVYVMVVVMQGL